MDINDSVELQRRIEKLEKQVNQLFGHSLALAACLAVSRPMKFDPAAALSLLPHLADRGSLDEIDQAIRVQAQATIRLMHGLADPPEPG
jgi:hypothetical protein